MQSKGLSRVFSSPTVQKHHFFGVQPFFGEGNGNPLQYSCLVNPRDRGAWWAAIYGVAQSWTRLMRLSRNISSLLLGRKAMTNLDSRVKSRDITLPTKVRLVKAMVFPVVMYGCERWTIKLSTKELMLLNCGVGEDS